MNGFNVILGQLFLLLVIGGIILLYLKTRPKKKDAVQVGEPPAHEPVSEKYWTGNWYYIGGKYREIKIDGRRAVFCYDYYPKGKYGPRLEKQDYAHQQEILSFKNGDYYRAVELVSDFIQGHFWKGVLRGWMLCIIPASTQEMTERRFKTFCEEVSKRTGIINGYSLIRRGYNRSSSRKTGKQDDTLEGIDINASAFYGKRVLLFDDITTRGLSFCQIADNLESAGAREVVGFFIGKTVY